MKAILLSALTLLIGASAGPRTTPQSTATATPIKGDYVEVRTASVFAGACHYNGELVTTGRDAVMAWSFTSGSYNGVDLAGVRAAAAVTSEANLGQDQPRKVELIVDTKATDAQATALAGLLREKHLGDIAAIRRAAVSFTHASDGAYTVKADEYATMSVRPMPNNECCAQPNLVWYTPLTTLEHRKVGYTDIAAYLAGHIGDRWERSGENSAFYGTFAF
jgi:hypothetical protein